MNAAFIHSYDDRQREFESREAARESAHAATLSQAEGRAVDAFGFAIRNGGLAFDPTSLDALPDAQPGATQPVGMPHTVLDRATRLWIARTVAGDRQRQEAAAAEIERQLMEEFEIPPVEELQAVAERWPEVYASVNKSN